MRCPKCGYISFDHLEKCMKCSRDLSSAREDLNLLALRPDVPFLLGSLVGEMQGGDAQKELSLTQETELELSGFDVGESSGSGATVDMGSLGDGTEQNTSEEMSLSEISLDDLETIEASAMEDAEVGELRLDDLADVGGEQGGPADEDDEFLGLQIEMDEAAAEDFGSSDKDFTAELAASPMSASTDPEADLELDLNENDLSALAKELEDHLDVDAATSGKKNRSAGESGSEEEGLVLELEDD
jgi:hypothetical protein